MAFTGTPVVTQISDAKVRITGVSLAAGASGTVGLNGDATAEVELPDAFNPKVYDYNGTDVPLAASLQVWCVPVSDVANFAIPIRIVKAGTPFQITFTNDEAAVASAELEIYIVFH